ncbi:acid-sensing ion channel 5 isoform X2 [Neophocaena asiaeorientalis asiaeorientalis]|uniref:Acid-sensing ion channel 5 isoform X2 n=1 Tax=Neophocaena asiaeorientalis asiaeorientalis TaxID=1706337 RepID=A0A341BJM6_NEOAA|nr:acid-sensing ion channel 5 isoform X2 [Neophocaena asiaeorientalis asiaeorientalis]
MGTHNSSCPVPCEETEYPAAISHSAFLSQKALKHLSKKLNQSQQYIRFSLSVEERDPQGLSFACRVNLTSFQPRESPAADSQGCSRVKAGAHHVLVTLSISFPSDVPQPTSGPNVSDEDVCPELQADWAAKSPNKPELIDLGRLLGLFCGPA